MRSPSKDDRGSRARLLIADQRHVSTDYFKTMHIPLVKGRLLEATDDSRGEQVVMINRTMAARQLPDEDPIDRRVKTSSLLPGSGSSASSRTSGTWVDA